MKYYVVTIKSDVEKKDISTVEVFEALADAKTAYYKNLSSFDTKTTVNMIGLLISGDGIVIQSERFFLNEVK